MTWQHGRPAVAAMLRLSDAVTSGSDIGPKTVLHFWYCNWCNLKLATKHTQICTALYHMQFCASAYSHGQPWTTMLLCILCICRLLAAAVRWCWHVCAPVAIQVFTTTSESTEESDSSDMQMWMLVTLSLSVSIIRCNNPYFTESTTVYDMKNFATAKFRAKQQPPPWFAT